MKVELFNFDDFVSLNVLAEITSPILFERGNIPNPDGLISNEIFGVNIKSRKETFAYIDLHSHFMHPHAYKCMKRLFRNVEKIINGTEYYSIDKQGHLVKDPSGETGIEFLYDNWNKIKWEKSKDTGMRNERIDLLTKNDRDVIFISKSIVIPAFYRDISSDKGGGGETTELNNFYTRLIRLSALIEERDMFDFSFHGTNYNIQNTLVDIYDYFKNKLDKKSGLMRKYLLGKNTDYAVRSVISAPMYHGETPYDNITDFDHTALPIAQVCVLCYPFIVSWLGNFFERELIQNKSIKYDYNPLTGENDKLIELKNPESYYTDTYIKKAIDRYIDNPASRYDKIEVPTTSSTKRFLRLSGKTFANNGAETGIDRYMTWTDLLFIAANDIVKDKHVLITRYPLLDSYGMFVNKIRVSSTLQTSPVEINGTVYKWYPVIDLSLTHHELSNNFVDTIVFSNAYLDGLGGDYDGDQITAKVLWSQEANEDCKRAMANKSNILNVNGSNIRKCDNEAIQTLYVLTKNPS